MGSDESTTTPSITIQTSDKKNIYLYLSEHPNTLKGKGGGFIVTCASDALIKIIGVDRSLNLNTLNGFDLTSIQDSKGNILSYIVNATYEELVVAIGVINQLADVCINVES